MADEPKAPSVDRRELLGKIQEEADQYDLKPEELERAVYRAMTEAVAHKIAKETAEAATPKESQGFTWGTPGRRF